MVELHVPGYDVGDLLGFGAAGEVWAARDRVTHAPVALKRVRVPGEEARERLLREAAVLSRIQHPHVVRLLEVLCLEGSVVLVLEHAGGGSLRRLLAARGRLAPGEVVTVLVPLAQALVAVHGHGVVHGDVTPANVLLSVDGRPLLADLGVSQLFGVAPGDVGGTLGFLDPAVGAGSRPGPESDVHGLAATCWAALTGSPPYDEVGARRRPWLTDPAAGPLVALLEAAMAPEPGDRPGPAALADAAFRAAQAVPLHRPGLPLDARSTPDGEAVTYRVRAASASAGPPAGPPAGRGAAPGSRRRRAVPPHRRLIGSALAIASVLLAVLTVLAAGSRGGPQAVTRAPSAPAARGASGAPSTVSTLAWATVLQRLDARRSAAFARADPAALEAVYARAAPALRRDRDRLAALVTRGQRAEGLRLRATEVSQQDRHADRVVLRVVDVLAPYTVRSLDSGRATPQPGRGARAWRVTLVRDRGRWRFYDVVSG
jgi:hypothetical protein